MRCYVRHVRRLVITLLLGVLLLFFSGTPGAGTAPEEASTSPEPLFLVALSATPSYGGVPLVVLLNATAISGVPTSYNWSFGDGTPDVNVSSHAPWDPRYHTYGHAGYFDTTVTVHEGLRTSSANITIHVVPSALEVSIVASPLGGEAPLTVSFEGRVTGGTGTYASYSWTFGDASSGTGIALDHSYRDAGTYLVTFTVTDSKGTPASATTWVNVTAAAASPSSLEITPLFWALGLGAASGGLALYALLRLGGIRTGQESRETKARREVADTQATTDGSVATTPTAITSPPTASSSVEAVVAVAVPGTVPISPPKPPEVSGATQGVTARPARPSRPKATPPSRDALRVSERVVVHLALQGALHADDVAPVAFTQQGMAETLGVRQNALTNVLRRLEAGGILLVDVRHVRGRPRRMKVYRLTGRGEALAKELRRKGATLDPGRGAAKEAAPQE
ncbi:MAG: PKD domain-containing protein [Euryarchaeota archaeon]|nr:PKD domain-containing protein [Euryarchaeota archaeon]MDE1836419.1 PKD domain-containing protein [Euryarchaeota archaeon]MDE1879066.1 PKD domain-containing protein [Euryarchaeota archaeon]MDE2044167.1 PKD domain-containing protein [Thermoplasmata archaeon]